MKKNKIAIVCGASKGMGLAIVENLASNGINVMMIARTEEKLQLESKKINQNGGKTAYLAGDLSDKNLPEKTIDAVLEEWGEYPDILVNNTGGPKPGKIIDFEDEDWDFAYQLCLMSFVRFTKTVIPHMEKKKWGRIINITSTVAKEPSSSMVLSASFRAGISALTKAISSDLAPNNITINTICPGGVLTERLYSLIEQQSKKTNIPVDELIKENQKKIPIDRFADPAEIANVVEFLASEKSSYLTGTSIDVDGGLTKSYF